jgi:hypothetical protein
MKSYTLLYRYPVSDERCEPWNSRIEDRGNGNYIIETVNNKTLCIYIICNVFMISCTLETLNVLWQKSRVNFINIIIELERIKFYSGKSLIRIQWNGRTIAQAVIYRFPIAAARDRTQVRLCGIRGGQNNTGESLLRILRFPLPILILSTSGLIASYPGAGTVDRLVADVPSGLSLTPHQEKLRVFLSPQANYTDRAIAAGQRS